AWGEKIIDLDDAYAEEVALRRDILAGDPTRLTELPHMRPAAWDALLTVLRTLTAEHPETMTLHRLPGEHGEEARLRWVNNRLGTHRTFRYGDDTTLPEGPLAFLGTQIQDDVVLLDERDGRLWADAGLVTFASNWSLAFVTGLPFLEVHRPVPRDLADGAIPRAERFLLRMAPGETCRRTNWTVTVGDDLDQSLEAAPVTGPHRARILDAGLDPGRDLHLRVEVQHLLRLAESAAILFLIRTCQLSFAEVAGVPEWRARLAAVLAELPEDVAAYKGVAAYREPAVAWLRQARRTEIHVTRPSG
ncbi:MAG: DUF3445 domain-containing protein, partial [Streptosporangiales bacterium]|nr:DUF3445 domain-containing protein [Streptosporangiales bacterium]